MRSGVILAVSGKQKLTITALAEPNPLPEGRRGWQLLIPAKQAHGTDDAEAAPAAQLLKKRLPVTAALQADPARLGVDPEDIVMAGRCQLLEGREAALPTLPTVIMPLLETLSSTEPD